ncbi:acyl-phosphate glycerol-3-phosphate acyltransferase [Breoghania corrubedonensis]|uniref:Glycerol-3-phosphate acyltransferase n=1 Tax=Breoghania corrubedonensis TaxID=665038 RepID=A0A2T5VCK0_9HYPH|nr:glycerol-3-phosphate 1-O-acyltransferase PlsY [Breoghania corrubedonensis]PTW61462.1 acyl-phosphate glycerol-3-phosphate acyltransferase [Breoghania corrubedonensis]
MPDPISWAIAWPYFLAALIGGYLLGSIPFGLLITHAAGLGDIRSIGSGNIGTTNVLRTGKKSLAAATLLGDMLKGTAAVLIAWYWAGIDHAVIAGFGAFLGHIFPVWLKFRGGKGVATYIGILLGLFWPGALIFCAIWIYVAVFTRYSSFSALSASLAAPFVLAALGQWQFAELFALLTLLIWAKHHTNISRLIKGTEARIGAK